MRPKSAANHPTHTSYKHLDQAGQSNSKKIALNDQRCRVRDGNGKDLKTVPNAERMTHHERVQRSGNEKVMVPQICNGTVTDRCRHHEMDNNGSRTNRLHRTYTR